MMASAASAAQFTLSWTDNATNETGFRIERSADGTNFSEIALVAADVVSYVDTSLPNSTTYWYRVRAYNSAGNSGYSNVATGVTPPPASNSAPTISDIANQSIAAGSNTGALAFSVADVETAAGSLSVTAASSNLTLVPNANVVLGGTGANRTVTVTPAAGQAGSATITVTVSDGALSSSDTFVVTVAAVNTAPTITDIANRTISEDASTGAVAFSIGDGQTAAGSLTLSATSSNTALVPTASIVFGGSGSARTVTVTPVANQSGNATITITVSDGSLTASDSFVLTVSAVNDAPSIGTIANRTIDQDTSTGAIAFTVSDIETAASSLTLSAASNNTVLVPASNVVFGGTAGNRTVTVTPVAGQSGTATITVTLSDGALTAARAFVLTVNAANTAPTITDIANRTIDEDGSTGAIAFTIGDAQTSASSLVVTRSSSNTTVVPLANVVLGGSGASRTVSVAPAANQSGTSTITVTVSDGTYSVSDTFVLTVNAVNDVPTITNITDRTISQDGSTGAISIAVGDVETAVGSLALTASSSNTAVVPAANLVLGGSGANRTLTVTPAAGASGTTTITVVVSDGAASASDTFVVTVSSGDAAPTITQQPSNASVVAGGSVSLTVAATGIPAPSYTWRKNGVAIAGATGATYTIATAQASDAGTYTVVVSNTAGSVTSAGATVTVTESISIVSQPASQTVAKGAKVTLSVVASGTGLSYQWFSGASGDTANPVAGANGASYITPKLSTSKSYWVRVSNPGQSVNSSAAVLDVVNKSRFGSGSISTNTQGVQPMPVLEAGVATDGTFAVMIGTDGTLQMLGFNAAGGLVIDAGGVALDDADAFSFEVPGVGTVIGQISGDVITGSIVGTSTTFSGLIDALEGTTSALAGWYNGVVVNSSNDEILVLAGSEGRAFVLAYASGAVTGGLSLIDGSGALTAALPNGRSVDLMINGASGRLTGTTLAQGKLDKVSGTRAGDAVEKRLVNTSVRAHVRTGDALMVAGFVIGGSGEKRVLIRAVGPSLAQFGVTGLLADPVVTLFRVGTPAAIAQNDDWGKAANATDIAGAAAAVGAFALSSSSKDAVLLVQLPAGVYTAQVTGAGGTTGAALVEVYDADASSGSAAIPTQLANISMRGIAGTGNEVVIAGFVVTGNAPKQVLIRSVGAELANYGVSGVASDPTLAIFSRVDGKDVLIATNNDWGVDAAAVSVAGDRVGAFRLASGSTSSAMVIWLEPGVYTAHAGSNSGTSGVALVEVYEVQ